jgi:hypothetical protein
MLIFQNSLQKFRHQQFSFLKGQNLNKKKQKMKPLKYFLTLCVALSGMKASAQIYSYNELARTFSQSGTTGAARFQAIGGSHTALAADLTSISSNPAGLGFYKRSELGLSLGLNSLNSTAQYIDGSTDDSKLNVNLPNFGIVFGGNGSYNNQSGDWRGAFGVSYNRQASLHNNFSYEGTNNRSSFVDYVAEQATLAGYTGAQLDGPDHWNSQSQQALSTEGLFYQAYLINPTKVNANGVGLPPYARYDVNSPVRQTGSYSSKGAISNWTFGYGTSYKDKFYLGGSLGLARMRFDSKNSIQEVYTTGKSVRGMTYNETLVTDGSGLNISLGIIYKPTNSLRVGAAYTSPTWYSEIKETFNQNVTPNVIGIPSTDNNGKPVTITSVSKVESAPNEFTYQLRTPSKASVGIAYFFGKNGFISADVESVGYAGMQVSSEELSASADANFKNKYNGRIKNNYQNAMNVKLGGEYRTGTLNFRAGVAQYGDPYKSSYDGIDRSQLVLSGGIGVRNETFYFDAAVTHSNANSAYTPYVIQRSTSDYTSAKLNNSNTNLILSVGVFF